MGSFLIDKFLNAFISDWLARMSGGISVVLSLIAIASDQQTLPSWTFWIAAEVCMVLASYRIWFKEYSRANAAQKRLDVIEEVKPHIELMHTYIDVRPIIKKDDSVVGRPFFVGAVFINDPSLAVPSAVAKDVVAQVTYFDKEGEEIGMVFGRWADNEQPSMRSKFVSTTDLFLVDFPIGVPRELVIALKYPEEDCCYGFHNGSYIKPGWRENNLKLADATHKIGVSLRGPWVSETFFFLLRNFGKGNDLKLETDNVPKK